MVFFDVILMPGCPEQVPQPHVETAQQSRDNQPGQCQGCVVVHSVVFGIPQSSLEVSLVTPDVTSAILLATMLERSVVRVECAER